MSPQDDIAVDDDGCVLHSHHQLGHPKAERDQAKEDNSRAMAKRPVYPLKNKHQPQPADKASPGDTDAHSYDGPELCRRILPRDRQEPRGCKARDVDKRNKRWNKMVYVGVIVEQADEAGGSYVDSDADMV